VNPTFNGLSPGSHTFHARATDAYGNLDATPASFTWTVDVNTPTITGPADPSNDANPSIAFSMAESGWTFTCSLDGAAAAACTSPVPVGPLADASHTFTVTANDG